MQDVAIVGGGPAGAICGERLAREGFRVVIFDERPAWEKPCGGGLTHKAIQAYPFLLDSAYPKKIIHKAELIAASGERAQLELRHPVVIYSRAVLNGALLDRAVAAGCEVRRARVTRLETDDSRARLHVNGDPFSADFVVVAAGARNRLLPGTSPLAPRDLELTAGYFVPVSDDVLRIKFLHGFPGYLWSFPRADHLSVGICGSMAGSISQQLKDELHAFMREQQLPVPSPTTPVAGARFYSHVLPSPQAATLRNRTVVGRNWALIGDAAAWVDPLTGEGLHYAMRSGEILAETLARAEPESYPARVRREFSADLEIASRVARRFYRGTFLGAAFTTRMVQFVQMSPALRQVMSDLFSGAQDYRSLKKRLKAQMGNTVTDFLLSLLGSRKKPLPFPGIANQRVSLEGSGMRMPSADD